MRTTLIFAATMFSGLGVATREYASSSVVLDGQPSDRTSYLPAPLPPSLRSHANALLRAYGFRDVEAPEPPRGYRVWGTVVGRVTAYEPSAVSCGRFADGKTSTLRNAWNMDGCAVAPDAIPYGTLLWIPGIGWRVADDTGGAMKRSWRQGVYHVDVRVPSVSQARRWGVQDMMPMMLCVPQ